MACRSSFLGSRLAEDRTVLGDGPGPFGFSSFVLGHFVFLDVGLGLSIKWVGVVKFFDLTIFILKVTPHSRRIISFLNIKIL